MRGCGSACLAFALIVLFSALPSAASSGQTADEATPYYTNKDIEKYAAPADSKPADSKAEPPAKTAVSQKEASERKKTDKEQEYWCRKASAARKTLEKRQDRISEIEKEIAEKKDAGASGAKAGRSLQRSLDKATREYHRAEKDFAEIGDEAHRKGIPPGWLRCQFE
ncbi:MAG: hypothetical protein M0Z60_08355 [Nitrospiraceae bacterium]|nr:hypothetical protein [Nitrospiraceae bacterium]